MTQPADFNYTDDDLDTAETNLITQLQNGVSESEIDGRRIKYMDPLRRLQAIQEMAANITAEDDGGFLKIKFKSPE